MSAVFLSACSSGTRNIGDKIFSTCPDYSGSSAATGKWGGHWLASGDLSGSSYRSDQWNLLISGNNVEGCFESIAAYMGKFETTISSNGYIGTDIYASGSYIRLEGVLPVLTISDGKGRKSTLTFHGGNQVASQRKSQASIESKIGAPQKKKTTRYMSDLPS